MSLTRAQKPAATSFSLTARKHVSLADQGLVSSEGARQVIDAISSRRSVTNLTLNHNRLGDEGCKELFKFLCSPEGRKHPISSIGLISNGISGRGLVAIAQYLDGSTTLKELLLQGNVYGDSPDCMSHFAAGVNASQLEKLAFSTPRGSSDSENAFINLLNKLDSPYLSELQLSMAGLTYACIEPLVDYISSRRCRLTTLKASANYLGLRGVREIINTVQRHNFALIKLDLYANELAQDIDEVGGEDEERLTWQDCEKKLKLILLRNVHLKRETHQDAFTLLRHSRTLLLHSEKRTQLRYASSSPSPSFCTLPTELQLHILSFLAPSLSTAQLIRVFNYASSSATLPQLLPPLISSGCIPDPSSLPFGDVGTLGSKMGGGQGGCANGMCMGAGNSVNCRREAEREKWLIAVGCSTYEPEKSGS